jgi:hypothetical protein
VPEVLSGIKNWSSPGEYFSPLDIYRRGRWLMFGDLHETTAFIDLDAWPPSAVVNRSEYAVAFDVLPDGRLVVCSMPAQPGIDYDDRKIDYAVRIHPADWPTNPAAGPAEVYPNPGGLTSVTVWAIADRVVAFGQLIQAHHPVHTAFLLKGRRFVPAPGLPPVSAFGRLDAQVHANGKVVLGTGETIFIWDGDGYEWSGKTFERRWELGAKGVDLVGQLGVPWGRDGFFYLSDRRPMYARRGKRPVRVLPDAENIMALSPGPEDSVILRNGRNAKSYVAQVWFPADGTYIPLRRGHFGYDPGELHWSATTRHIHFGPLRATVPDSSVLALKRVKPRDAGYQVPRA